MENLTAVQDEIDNLYPSEWYWHKKHLIRHLSDDETEMILRGRKHKTVIFNTSEIHKIENYKWHLIYIGKSNRADARGCWKEDEKQRYMSSVLSKMKISDIQEFDKKSIPMDSSYFKYGICLIRWLVPFDGSSVSVLLSKGKEALIDIQDLDKICDYKWHAVSFHTSSYARSGNIGMHNLILDHNDIVDHKNRNGLDNRRENLRQATILENAYNRKLRKDNKTGENGISYDTANKSYRAGWIENGKKCSKRFRISMYGSDEMALKAAKDFLEPIRKKLKNYNGEKTYADIEKDS
jgi:hypothetical protein